MWALKNDNLLIFLILAHCPRVDLDVVDAAEKHLEANTERKMMKDTLWTFTTVQKRMLLTDSLLSRMFGRLSRLETLAKDSVLRVLSTNNSQERLVRPLVERLGQNITSQARELLLASYSERREELRRMVEN